VPASRKKSKPTALIAVPGKAADILPGPAKRTKPATKTKSRQAPAATAGDSKMQTIYLRSADIDRVTDLEYKIKKSRSISGRIGLSLLVRAGLRLLSAEFEKSEARALQIVQAAATDEA